MTDRGFRVGWLIARRTLLALAALLAASAPALAAQPDADAGFETVRFRQYGISKGLSQASVRAITQDRRGFIWLGTQEGLNRFDGYEFRVFLRQHADDASLPDNHILALAPGPGDGVWVGTQNGGLALFDPYLERARRWPVGDPGTGGVAGSPVSALLAHRWGGLWVASGQPARLQFLADPESPLIEVGGAGGLDLGEVRALREAGDGALLVASSRGVFRVADASSPIERLGGEALPQDVRDVAENFDGGIWVATGSDGVWRIDSDGDVERVLHRAEGLLDESTRSLLFDRSGRLWIGSLDGLSRWQQDSGRMRVWRAGSGEGDELSSPRVESLFEDRDGLLWVGTWFNGVNLHDPRSEAFAKARHVPGNPRALPGSAVVDVLPAADGEVWIALSDLNRAVRLSLEQGVLETVDPRRAGVGVAGGGLVRAQAMTADGSLWVAFGNKGLLQRRPDGGIAMHAAGGDLNVPEGDLFELQVDAGGTLWAGSIGGGLAQLCAGCSRFERFAERPDDPHAFPGREVVAIRPSADGSIWIGTRFHGLVRLLPDRSRFEHYPAEASRLDGLAHPNVTCLMEDRDGVLWVGTQGGGLHRVHRDAPGRAVAFERFDRARGLAAEAVGGIEQDAEGQLWVSTTLGLSRIDPVSGAILNFGENEGALAGGYFIGSSSRLADGRLLFGGPRGLTVFDPRDVQPPPPPGLLAISGVRVLGAAESGEGRRGIGRWIRDEGHGDRLVLESGVDDFSLELSALSFSAPEQLQFEYRMEPHEPWRLVEARRRFASYSNLPPGEHLFLARALRPHGAAGEMLSLRVSVSEPHTPWEDLGRVAIPVSLLFAVLLMILAAVRQRERMQARRQMAESEARLKLALWGTGDELWDFDLLARRLHRENPLPHVMSAREAGSAGSDGLGHHVHPDDRAEFERALRRVLEGDTDVLDVSVRVERTGGGHVWLRTRGRVSERDALGRALRLTGTRSDISELKHSAEALEEANLELERRVDERTAALTSANRELGDALEGLRRAQHQLVEQEKMAALGGLVAGVAHEINTPIGIGVTAASHLESCTRDFARRFAEGRLTRSELKAFSEVAGESADLILRNLHRADRLIKSFKQVAVDQSSESRRPIDLAEYIDEILTAWNPRLRRSRHRVLCEVPTGIRIETLPGAIYQVLSNLLQNSLVHGFADRDEGGTIRISAEVRDGRLHLRYADDGVGMDETVRARVFEPFFTTRRGAGGSGLGLHIVYNLVTQALGGRITCESASGQGVLFRIDLPGPPDGPAQASSG